MKKQFRWGDCQHRAAVSSLSTVHYDLPLSVPVVSQTPVTRLAEEWMGRHSQEIYNENEDDQVSQYSVYVFCNQCGSQHPMGIGIHLGDGPNEKQSLGDMYEGRSRPPQVWAIKGHKCLCPKTGKHFVQEDDKQVFLVPVQWTAADLDLARGRV
jgi:hypothetical protein